MSHPSYLAAGASVAALLALTAPVLADQQFFDDVIITQSLCVGQDCVNGESFGFDTIRLKENNLRIKFQDTSVSASFPSNDWEITANDSSNGGDNYLAFTDVNAGRIPFLVEAGAQANTLYVEADGDIGVKTDAPVVDVHIVEGNTPTLRLDQDGSDGFTPQTWDLAGNEANFFIRDVTNGSKLSFRVRPSAPESSLDIASDGDIGIGTSSPAANIHVRRTAADLTTPMALLEGDMGNGLPHLVLRSTDATGRAELWFEDGTTTTANDALRLQLNGDAFNVSFDDTSGPELIIAKTGEVTVRRNNLLVPNGSVIVGGTALIVPDYVFAPEYELMPLEEVGTFISENSHLPHIPSAAEINAGSMDMVEMQLAVLKTVEELTLYTLEQHETIAAQAGRIEMLEERLRALEIE